MNKKQLPARLPVRTHYTVGLKYLPKLSVNNEITKSRFDWDEDEPLVKVVRDYLRYIAYKTFR